MTEQEMLLLRQQAERPAACAPEGSAGVYIDVSAIDVLWLLDTISDLRGEFVHMSEVRQHGCNCADDEACEFARERDEALKEVERLKSAIRMHRDEVWAHGAEDWADLNLWGVLL